MPENTDGSRKGPHVFPERSSMSCSCCSLLASSSSSLSPPNLFSRTTAKPRQGGCMYSNQLISDTLALKARKPCGSGQTWAGRSIYMSHRLCSSLVFPKSSVSSGSCLPPLSSYFLICKWRQYHLPGLQWGLERQCMLGGTPVCHKWLLVLSPVLWRLD